MSEKGALASDDVASSKEARSGKLAAALFYAGASLSTVFVMKIVLTTYTFPSAMFLGLCQFFLTTFIFVSLSATGRIQEIRPPRRDVFFRVLPITLVYLLNIITGLGGTKEISLPMFTVLRRFSIFFTMVLEAYVFGKSVSSMVRLSVGLMIGGALIAALSDLSFHPLGYSLILANDACTALYGVLIRHALSAKEAAGAIRQNELLVWNSALSFTALGAFMTLCRREELDASVAFAGWADPTFCALFLAAATAGCVLNYAIFLCTQRNSALTTTVVGCLKNVLTSYVGMAVGGDYVFSYLNFAGLNLSICGSLVYSYVTFAAKHSGEPPASTSALRANKDKGEDEP